MGRAKKEARFVKKPLTIFITDEELFRVKQMALTWGTNVSQMIAHLINQAFDSKVYLNGYDELTQDEREGLKARRAHVNFLTARRAEAARIHNFDRRNGLDRGLTNVMVVAAPPNLVGRGEKGFPGIFCKNLGNVWIVPYGLLNRISVIELMEYPCYASVFDYFAGNEIAKGGLSEFISSKGDYVLSSFGEKAILKRLFELYGHLRFPYVRQSEVIIREQRDELTHRITQYQRLLEKLKQVQAQKFHNARVLSELKSDKLMGTHQNDGLAGLEQSVDELKAMQEAQALAAQIEQESTLSPQETLAALKEMIPEGVKLDEDMLKHMQEIADGSIELEEEHLNQMREQIEELYQGLDTFFDEDGQLKARQWLEEAIAANNYYQAPGLTSNQAPNQGQSAGQSHAAGSSAEGSAAAAHRVLSVDELAQQANDLYHQAHHPNFATMDSDFFGSVGAPSTSPTVSPSSQLAGSITTNSDAIQAQGHNLATANATVAGAAAGAGAMAGTASTVHGTNDGRATTGPDLPWSMDNSLEPWMEGNEVNTVWQQATAVFEYEVPLTDEELAQADEAAARLNGSGLATDSASTIAAAGASYEQGRAGLSANVGSVGAAETSATGMDLGSCDASGVGSGLTTGDGAGYEGAEEQGAGEVVKRKRGRPAKPKTTKVARIVLPKYLASTAEDMASRVSERLEQIKAQDPHSSGNLASELNNNTNNHPMPNLYGQDNAPEHFMPDLDVSDYMVGAKGSRGEPFGLNAAQTIRDQAAAASATSATAAASATAETSTANKPAKDSAATSTNTSTPAQASTAKNTNEGDEP